MKQDLSATKEKLEKEILSLNELIESKETLVVDLTQENERLFATVCSQKAENEDLSSQSDNLSKDI